MGLKFQFLVVGFLLNLLGFGQKDSIPTQEYIETFPDKFTVRVGLLNTSNSFVFTDTNTANRVELEPNKKTYLGVSFLFRSLELDLGFSPDFISNNTDNEGSRLFTLNFRMFWNQWMQTLDFYSQKGFFVNTDLGNEQFPSIRTLKVGGTTAYIFNQKFSFRAVGFQNEWQKKSAGSFIPRFTFYYTRYGLQGTDFDDDVNSYDIAIGPGYHYNLVIDENYLFGVGSTAGAGINITSSPTETTTSALYELILRGNVGYNSERFYSGINANIIFLEHNENRQTRLDDRISFLEFYVGYRFNAPKKWIKAS
nr:DUF4421 family protein [Allomuricauda sp.]